MPCPSIFQWHFRRNRKTILKVVYKHERPQINKTILRKNTVEGIIPTNFKLYYEDTLIKTVWYLNKNRYTEQWKRIESPEKNPHIHGDLIFDKGVKNT